MNRSTFTSARKWLAGMGLVCLPLAMLISIIGVEITTCTQGDDDSVATSMILYTPITLLFTLMMMLGSVNPTRLKWLTIPTAFVLFWSMLVVLKLLKGMTIEGHHLCTIIQNDRVFEAYNRTSLSSLWAPVQVVVMAFITYGIYRYWRFDLKKSKLRY